MGYVEAYVTYGRPSSAKRPIPVEGKASAVGIGSSAEFLTDVLADEVIATAAIEGDRLAPASVRSSIARRLGIGTSNSQMQQVDGWST